MAWPASPGPDEEAQAGLAALAGLGYEVDYRPASAGPLAYLAGPDRERAAALAERLADPGLAGVIAGRGGYGCLRLLGHLDLAAAAGWAKPLVGFSDLTTLLCGLLRAGLQSIHGPSLASLGTQPPERLVRLGAILAGRWAEVETLEGRSLLGQGRARGYLVGGNLTILTHLIGTAWAPPTAGGIVFLEDTGERLYRLDRCLTHLLAAGFFQDCRGVAVGRLDGVEVPYDQALEMIAERLAPLGAPVVAGLPFGHGPDNAALVVGGWAELDAAAGTLAALEEA